MAEPVVGPGDSDERAVAERGLIPVAIRSTVDDRAARGAPTAPDAYLNEEDLETLGSRPPALAPRWLPVELDTQPWQFTVYEGTPHYRLEWGSLDDDVPRSYVSVQRA